MHAWIMCESNSLGVKAPYFGHASKPFFIHACVGYDCLKVGIQIFLVTVMLIHISSQENVPIETFNISFEAHRISNNRVLKLPTQG